MFLPLRTDAPLRRSPYMNWGLILFNLAIFCVQIGYEKNTGVEWRHGLLDPRHSALWQYVTYGFLHASPMHLIGNMIFLYLFGNNVNDKMGHAGYLGFYLSGTVMAGVAHVLTSATPVLGASGAVMAVTGAYLVLFPRSHVTVLYFFYLIGTIEIQSLWFILASLIYQDLFPVLVPAMFEHEAVAHWAHLGGIGYGFLICMILLSVRLLPRDNFDVLALLQRWNRRRQYRDVVSAGYDPFAYVAPNRKADPNQERIQDLRAEIAEAIAHEKLADASRLYLQLMAIDPKQVLAKKNQLDVANQLFEQRSHESAAHAYELFLSTYPKYEQFEQVQLMLGVLYSRYLSRYDKAKEHLTNVLPRLHTDRETQLAKEELVKAEGMLSEK